jgi:integrase/recombinase XerD
MGRTRQYAGRVNVIKRIKIGDRWPFAAVVEKNGKLVRDHVWVAGKDEHHSEGRYYLEWYEGNRRRRQAVPDFAEVIEAARRKSIEVNALRAGIIEPEQQSEEHRLSANREIKNGR